MPALSAANPAESSAAAATQTSFPFTIPVTTSALAPATSPRGGKVLRALSRSADTA